MPRSLNPLAPPSSNQQCLARPLTHKKPPHALQGNEWYRYAFLPSHCPTAQLSCRLSVQPYPPQWWPLPALPAVFPPNKKQPDATLSPGLRRPHRAPPGSVTGPIAAGKQRSSLRLQAPHGPADTTISPHCATTCAIYCGLHHTRARFLHECITATHQHSPALLLNGGRRRAISIPLCKPIPSYSPR